MEPLMRWRMAKDSIKLKCQAIWMQAFKEPVTLHFPDSIAMQRARFTLYDSMKKRVIEGRPDLARVREACEITSNKKELTITIMRKEDNPFHDHFDQQMDLALEGALDGAESSDSEALDLEMEKSLEKLQGKLDEPEEREDTPYYKRGD